MFDVIIAANGNSTRMGFDKLSAEIGKKTVLQRTADAFANFSEIGKIILVCSEDPEIEGVLLVNGGKTRMESVAEGLKYASSDYVLIHDGARPFVSRNLIERVMAATVAFGSAIPCLSVTDSLRKKEGGSIIGSADRNDFVAVQTPQGFKTELLKRAFSAAAGKIAAGKVYTDESEIYTEFIAPCRFVEGESSNRKLTRPEDFYGLNARIGTGFDVHKYVKGKPFKLCGVEIPYEYGLLAHSDGDAALHALADALLTSVGERDIGFHFPDTDPAFKDADSTELLKIVMNKVSRANAEINYVNLTLIAQTPKLSPYIEKMRQNIAALLGTNIDKVTVSATTTENLGLIGDGKALAALASVVII